MSVPNESWDRAPAWRRYLRFWRDDPAADVADELRFHLESAIAEYRAAGLSQDAARAEARRRFGDLDAITRTLHSLTRERGRTMKRQDWFDAVRQDVRIAARRVRRSPGFTFVTVATLAFGLSANSAVFSVVHAVLIRPLPYRNAERLLNLREGNGPDAPNGMFVTFGNYGAWVERSRAFEAFAGFLPGGSLALTGPGDPQQLRVIRATASYWRALYIPPALGSYFDTSDTKPGVPKVVVLSYGLWQSTFGGDAAIVGRSIRLGADLYTVRGVAAPEYALTPQAAAAWIPLVLTEEMLADHSDHELTVVGLVRDGVGPARAVAELTRIQRELRREHPNGRFDGEIIARPYLDYLVGPTATVLRVLFAAVGLVLIIACLNIANLLMARAAARRKEIAVRGALGAGRARIVMQLMVESLVLAGSGAVAGLAVAVPATRFLVRNGPETLPRLREASLDGTVVLFTGATAVACAVLFGLLPALRVARLDLQSTLREAARTDAGSARQPLRATLVVLQVSIALILVVGASLLVRSAVLLHRVPPGFDPTNVFVGGLSLPNARYPTDAAVSARYAEILNAIGALPGVRAAGLVSRIPIETFGDDCSIRPADAGRETSYEASRRGASSAYFTTLGVPLVFGRTFGPGDTPASSPVAIINRRLARAMFGTENVVGRRIVGCGPFDAPAEVVGVIGDIRSEGLASDVRDQVYYASTQFVVRSMTLVVRGDVSALGLLPAIRRAVNGLDPLLPIAMPRTMEAIMARALATPRFQSTLLAGLGLAGLGLAAVGIYGVIALLVAQRTHEFGVRIALGARPRQVLAMVVRQELVMVGTGVVVGATASLALSPLLEDMLFGVAPRDPLTFVGGTVLLVVVAGVASAVPAWRATRVDPLVAMRS